MLKIDSPQNFRTVVVLSALTGKPVELENINSFDKSPGIREYELNFLNLVSLISNGTKLTLSKKGDSLRFTPGMIINNDMRELSFDCSNCRAIGYYLEPLVLLALFGKTDLEITLKGITNDGIDQGVDVLAQTLPIILEKFNLSSKQALIKINKRGYRPNAQGEVYLKVAKIARLDNCEWKEMGLVKRVRGICYASKVSVNFIGRAIAGAREVLNSFLPDVWVHSEYSKGGSGGDGGMGISLWAEGNAGNIWTGEAHGAMGEELGKEAALALLEEVMQSGVVDTHSQGFLLMLMALSGGKPSRAVLGRLSPHTVITLRLIREFFGVTFLIASHTPATAAPQPEEKESQDGSDEDSGKEEEPSMNSPPPEIATREQEEIPEYSAPLALFTCVGIGLKNFSRELN